MITLLFLKLVVLNKLIKIKLKFYQEERMRKVLFQVVMIELLKYGKNNILKI